MSGRKALYFIFLCQAFLQETRSHMIYHVIKGDWGRFPQQAAFWVMGPECIACYSLPEKHVNAATLKKQGFEGMKTDLYRRFVV